MEAFVNPFAPKVEALLLGGAQKCNPSVCQWMLTCGAHYSSRYSSSMGSMPRIYLPWKKREQRQQAVMLMHAGSHCNIGWDVARGHSQTWEFGNTPRFPYTVRALLSEGQKSSHWQQEASRQEVWRQAEWGVWVQTLPCPSCSFPAAMKGSQRTINTLPHFKKLTWNNYLVSLSSLHTEENVRAAQRGGTAST